MKKIIGTFIITAIAFMPVAIFASDPGVTLTDNAPIYTGPVLEGDLEELTEADFEEFGIEPESPQDQYRQYRKLLEQAPPGLLVPYRMRIVDQDLALDDFIGLNVPEELAEARYDGYLSMIPATVDGRTIHYVYVYHAPLARTVRET
jgi:hypothetical protein